MKNISVRGSLIHGKGLFAEEDIRKGDKIQYIPGPKVKMIPKNEADSEEIANWIGISKHFWIDTRDTIFNFINHSCEPNAAIAGIRTLYALEDIPMDAEIAIDYSMTDADPYWKILCDCKNSNCRKEIRAIYTVPPEVFERHMPYIPRYFQRTYLNSYIIENKLGKSFTFKKDSNPE